MTTNTLSRTDFAIETTPGNPGPNPPQRAGRRLWAPMLALALMAWPIGLVLSWVRAAELATANPDTVLIARLGQLVPAFMFLGFAGVFSAISFAIARILGEFRTGGGSLQEAVGVPVQSLVMPATARAFIGLMMLGLMTIVGGVVVHLIVAGNVDAWTTATIERWSAVLEGIRRFGVGLYLFAIVLGLGTIIHVLRFQTSRVAGLAAELT